ncbi:hypothetical protein G5574_23355 (plasmid) [Pantoea stewartii]|uniref:hypothetical protein n=1 Tax=Pantoea stewartii TaxID=66269 RepID=UPI0013DDAA3B|nr:hypothetical protein [Pantoea stewartii]QIE99923.1 hypothetical protein G5574_23355 [Pantoea stewartii]
MGLFTQNIYNDCTFNNQVQSEPAHRPPENNGNNGNKDTWIEIVLGVVVSFYADPHLNGVKAMLTQALEVFQVSPDYAPTVSAIACFTVVCAAPAVIRRSLRKLLN